MAGGIAWLALALSSILSLERLFERDLEDGALDLVTGDLSRLLGRHTTPLVDALREMR